MVERSPTPECRQYRFASCRGMLRYHGHTMYAIYASGVVSITNARIQLAKVGVAEHLRIATRSILEVRMTSDTLYIVHAYGLSSAGRYLGEDRDENRLGCTSLLLGGLPDGSPQYYMNARIFRYSDPGKFGLIIKTGRVCAHRPSRSLL